MRKKWTLTNCFTRTLTKERNVDRNLQLTRGGSAAVFLLVDPVASWKKIAAKALPLQTLRWLPVTAAPVIGRSSVRYVSLLRTWTPITDRSLFDFGLIHMHTRTFECLMRRTSSSNFCLTAETNRTFEHSFHPYHFQTSSFYSTVVDRAWFFTSNKIKLPKILRFLQCKLLFSYENNAGSNFLHSSTFFYRLGIERKKVVLNIEQWKTKERLCEIYQNLLNSFMITQNKGELPTCLALTSVTEQFSNYSSNQVYFSPVMILFLKLNLDNNWRRVPVKISSVFFFHVRTESARESCWS